MAELGGACRIRLFPPASLLSSFAVLALSLSLVVGLKQSLEGLHAAAFVPRQLAGTTASTQGYLYLLFMHV